MGKRDLKDSSGMKSAKKLKIQKEAELVYEAIDVGKEHTIEISSNIVVEELPPEVGQEEEIVCDGEMEVPQVCNEQIVTTEENITQTMISNADANQLQLQQTDRNESPKSTSNKTINKKNNATTAKSSGQETPKIVSSKVTTNRKPIKKPSNKIDGTKSPVASKVPSISKKQLNEEPLEAGKNMPAKNVVSKLLPPQNITTAEAPDELDPTKPSTSKANAFKKSALPNTPGVSAKKSKKRRDSGTSSEEERWLTALESGKLLEVKCDELKKMKDPKLMTARQRAMYDRNNDDDEPSPGVEMLLSLPSGYREKEKPQTAEEIQKAALKIQRRRQQADERRERDKKKTMERLLKKQESRQRSARNKNAKAAVPMIRYKQTLSGACIQMPLEHEFPLQAQQPREPPAVQQCSIAGCTQPKVYNCSKTNVPLCSLACYRKNVRALRQIIC